MKKRVTGSVMAAALAVSTLSVFSMPASAVEVKAEFEDGTQLNDATVESTWTGFSGTGYVHLGDNMSGTIPEATVTVTMEEAGDYDLKIGYSASYGSKQGDVKINGAGFGTAVFEETAENEFKELDMGRVSLQAGENTITVVGTWGWTELDYVLITDYVPPKRPEIKATQTNTSDPDAMESTKQVMAYLSSIYGKQFLVGQQEIYHGGPHDEETEFKYIKETTGKEPSIRGFDFGNYCNPCFGSDDGSFTRALEWGKKGGLVTASFHLNVPTDFASYEIGSALDFTATTYSEKTDFSPSKAAVKDSKENQYYTQALDKLAEQLLVLQENDVTVLWRPLHEAEGNGGEGSSWFWWGREGSKAYRDLWKYTYDYLTNVKGCHNLIWEWNSYDYGTSANWYPGDAYVDLIGYDKYNCNGGQAHNVSAIPDTFYNIMGRYNSAKMVAMFECDSIPTLANIEADQAGWLYYMPWYDGGTDSTNFLSNPNMNDPADLKELYNSEQCITLDELPDFSSIEVDPEATNPVENTEPTEPEPGHASVTKDPTTGEYKIDFPKAADKYYLDVEGTGTGGLGVSIEVDGKYYWVNIQWNAEKSGEVEIDPIADILNVTLNVDGENQEITDEAILDAVKEKLKETKSFTGQVWDGDVVIKDAYIKDGSSTGPTEPVEDTTEPTEKPSGGKEEGTVTVDPDGKTIITIPRPTDKLYLDVEFGEGVTAVTGGLGCVAEVDGKYYWANIEWKAEKPGEVEVDLANMFRDATLDDEPVTDEAILEAIKDAILQQTQFEGQIWYVGIGGEEGDLSEATIKGAYLKTDEEVPTEPTEEEKPTEPVGDVTVGDLDGSGTIELEDVIYLNKAMLGLTDPMTEAQTAAADVNLDGVVTTEDSITILRYVVELIDTLPLEE